MGGFVPPIVLRNLTFLTGFPDQLWSLYKPIRQLVTKAGFDAHHMQVNGESDNGSGTLTIFVAFKEGTHNAASSLIQHAPPRENSVVVSLDLYVVEPEQAFNLFGVSRIELLGRLREI
jgi:hypothetical protein